MLHNTDNMPSKNEALDSLFDVEDKPAPQYDKYDDEPRNVAKRRDGTYVDRPSLAEFMKGIGFDNYVKGEK